eukprot:1182999-Prorocentrum_minimum.AAC.1
MAGEAAEAANDEADARELVRARTVRQAVPAQCSAVGGGRRRRGGRPRAGAKFISILFFFVESLEAELDEVRTELNASRERLGRDTAAAAKAKAQAIGETEAARDARAAAEAEVAAAVSRAEALQADLKAVARQREEQWEAKEALAARQRKVGGFVGQV